MNKNIEKIYYKMPIFAQNIAISLFGYLWKKKRFGGYFNAALENIKAREYYSYEQWNEYQTIELRKILTHAYKTVPYYTEKYHKAGIDLDFLNNITLDKLKLIPYTTKDDFREFGTTTMLSSIREKGKYRRSSGSTGTPTSIYASNNFAQQAAAYMEARILNWAGVSYKMPRGMVGGRRIIPESNMQSPFYRYNIFEKQTYFSAYHISESTISDYLKGIIDNKVEWMNGYAMSNFFIADLIQKSGLKAPQLKAVITSSEKLTVEMRRIISSVFQCKIFDSYSGCEFCGLISESNAGELLVNPDVGIMEFIKEDGNYVQNGEIGEIVSTGFVNYDQPLIRYRIGDMAKKSFNQTLLTDHKMIKVDEIIGRVEDIVKGIDGRKMVRFHSLFTNIPGLKQSQLIQKTFTDFEIILSIDNNIFKKEKSEKDISMRLESQLGKLNVKYKYVNSIPVELNGKVKAVISNVK